MDSFEIKNSKISGKGVFAAANIKRFRTICFLEGEEIPVEEMVKRVNKGILKGSDPLGIDDDLYIQLKELPRTFNHSCNPNAFIRKKNELIALKNIKKGEEITYDYSTTMNDDEIKVEGFWKAKCKCGSDNCRGIIDQFKTLPKETQNFYIKNKFAPNFILKKFRTTSFPRMTKLGRSITSFPKPQLQL